ncbi:AMP-binding protein [Syntrophomonas palmitatica]|uniref:AMP-binding protein n=1 Tax=Syntrophomonas palmitatica TaxID=402877 RepID=UPI0006D18AC6|nr:AMP-binding protein [Syntrophomonas palmitatica]
MIWQFGKFRSNIAVITEDGNSYSYACLENDCDKLINNITSGRCLIFNLCSNEIGSLIGYVAFINNHIVPLLLDAHLDSTLLDSLIEAYKPDYLWLPSTRKNEFEYFNEVYSQYNYSLLKTPYTNEYLLYDELALLLTTSGSTGSPKFVRQSYANINANTESIVEYLRLDETERPITTLPMSYTYGLSIINTHLYTGASIILTEKSIMQKEFWQQLKEYKATSFGGVPYTYEILDKLRFYRMDLPYLRTMTQAGGKLSPELHKRFAEYARENGKRFIVMYGQTEATARMSYLPHEKSIEKSGSMGIAIPGGKFSLIDINGQEISEPEVTGELVYQGANVTLGYAEYGEDLKKSDERGGILVTGDMAKRDEEGYYYIVGRKKRFLKIFGNRINLDETERIIKDNFKDCDCACGGIDDAMHIFVTNPALLENIKQFITSKTGLNHIAFKVRYIDAIPKNESGKTLYSELEKYYD